MRVVFTRKQSKLPELASDNVHYQIYSPENAVFLPHENKLISTGLRFDMDDNALGLIVLPDVSVRYNKFQLFNHQKFITSNDEVFLEITNTSDDVQHIYIGDVIADLYILNYGLAVHEDEDGDLVEGFVTTSMMDVIERKKRQERYYYNIANKAYDDLDDDNESDYDDEDNIEDTDNDDTDDEELKQEEQEESETN